MLVVLYKFLRAESVEVHLLLEEGRKEVCLDLGLQLGVGAGVLVLLVGIITICVYKICIEVRKS